MTAASVILEFPLFEFILPFLCSSRCSNVLSLDIQLQCNYTVPILSGYTITSSRRLRQIVEMKYYRRRDRLRDRNNQVGPDSESVACLVAKNGEAASWENYLDIAVIQNCREERYLERMIALRT